MVLERLCCSALLIISDGIKARCVRTTRRPTATKALLIVSTLEEDLSTRVDVCQDLVHVVLRRVVSIITDSDIGRDLINRATDLTFLRLLRRDLVSTTVLILHRRQRKDRRRNSRGRRILFRLFGLCI